MAVQCQVKFYTQGAGENQKGGHNSIEHPAAIYVIVELTPSSYIVSVIILYHHIII